MIWIAAAALAAVFVKFGMLVVMVEMLTIGLAITIAVSGLLALALLWRKFSGMFRKSSSSPTP
jgi:hypothetical protein